MKTTCAFPSQIMLIFVGSPLRRGEVECLGAAERAVPHAEKERDEGASDLRAAQAVDVEVEREVDQLQVVGHRPEHLTRGSLYLTSPAYQRVTDTKDDSEGF